VDRVFEKLGGSNKFRPHRYIDLTGLNAHRFYTPQD
jgi:hypothetical protein